MTIKLVGFQRLQSHPISVARVIGYDAMTGDIRWLGSELEPRLVIDLTEFRRLEAHKEVINLVGPSPELLFNTEDVRAICVKSMGSGDARINVLFRSVVDVSNASFTRVSHEDCWVLFEPVNAAKARIKDWLYRLCDRIDHEIATVDTSTASGRKYVDHLWEAVDWASWLLEADPATGIGFADNERFRQTQVRMSELDAKVDGLRMALGGYAEDDKLLQQEKQQAEHLQVFQKQFLSLLDARVDSYG